MDITTAPAMHHVPAWLVRLCQRLSTGRALIWSSLLNIVLSLIATWLFTAVDADFGKFPLTRLFDYWYVTLGVLVVLVAITAMVWAIGKLPVIEASRTLERQYLSRRILQTQDLAIEGIPLMPPHVQLDEVFIPMRLRPHQSEIDQLLTLEQRKLLREGIQRGRVARSVESVLIDAEHQYERMLRDKDGIEIPALWDRMTREHPAAVIQGYPGMGKSTLLLRLTLYMARKGRKESDPLGDWLSPTLIPLFIRLGVYATFLRKAGAMGNASIWKYLEAAPKELEELGDPGMLPWLRERLKHGQCIVLFDGLDEVSDASERYEVQEAIKSFISDVSSRASGAPDYNRFLITSRVAGYDKNAFPAYAHYTIAELTPEQIEAFLPRWCRASIGGDLKGAERVEAEKDIARRASAIEQKLNDAIKNHEGIRELVENPFLLTLLAIMQQNGIELPNRRVELFKVLTQILLETRNTRRGLPAIPEVQAIQRLGPIAYRMQDSKNSFATRGEVISSFAQTIEEIDKVAPQQSQGVAEAFLERLRERGGIFVLRTGDYLGFFHRTFQEYFAARHILRLLASDPQIADDLIVKARQPDDQWRSTYRRQHHQTLTRTDAGDRYRTA